MQQRRKSITLSSLVMNFPALLFLTVATRRAMHAPCNCATIRKHRTHPVGWGEAQPNPNIGNKISLSCWGSLRSPPAYRHAPNRKHHTRPVGWGEMQPNPNISADFSCWGSLRSPPAYRHAPNRKHHTSPVGWSEEQPNPNIAPTQQPAEPRHALPA